jgi:uncharacterized protein
MKKRTKIILWVVGVIIAIPVGLAAAGYITMRISQPQMFEDPVMDTVAPTLPADIENGAVLVYSKTSGGFRHSWSIDGANAMIERFAAKNGWQVFYTENAAVFNAEQLQKFSVVVWNNATGAALSEEQRQAFQIWLEAGGGYMGLHAAGDGSHESWDWYTHQIIKAPYNQHTLYPEHLPMAIVNVEDDSHPASKHLPAEFEIAEEWYAWHDNPRDHGANVLMTVDESSYTPGAASMGEDHPMVWYHQLGRGRVFYSAFGHHEEAYESELLVPMMEQGIIWAGRL